MTESQPDSATDEDGLDASGEAVQKKEPSRFMFYFDRAGYFTLLAVIVVSFVYESTPLTQFVFCNFRRLTSLPCPGCGLTRSFVAMSNADLVTAFAVNYSGPLLYVAVLAVLFLGAVRWASGGRWLAATPGWRRVVNNYWRLFGVVFVVNAFVKFGVGIWEIIEKT